jgi:hypothetical protein
LKSCYMFRLLWSHHQAKSLRNNVLYQVLQVTWMTSEVGKNNHSRTDNWGSVALRIYYFTTGGQDTQHPHQLRTKDFYHTFNNKISFILISITIHPSITLLSSLPSKSGFLYKKTSNVKLQGIPDKLTQVTCNTWYKTLFLKLLAWWWLHRSRNM